LIRPLSLTLWPLEPVKRTDSEPARSTKYRTPVDRFDWLWLGVFGLFELTALNLRGEEGDFGAGEVLQRGV
jgi:hypothetical protein